MIRQTLFIIVILLLFSACKEVYTPKPRGYFEFDYPERAYKTYDNPDCPCVFEYPAYGNVEQDATFFNEKPEHPCWLTIFMPLLNASIYLSYKDVDSREKFEKVLGDTYKLTFKHVQKADFIDESEIALPEKQVFGYMFDVGGNAASGLQFFITDSTSHFLRGALYFNTPPNSDSLQPALEFLRTDIEHLIKSTTWR